MAQSIWSAAAVTPAATDRIPVDTGAAGSPCRWTGQQIADASGFIGKTHNALGSISTNTAINLANGTYVSATIGGNLTFTITNPPASPNGCEFTLVLTNGGAYTITWPGSVSWAGGTAPTLTASGVNVLHFATGNGGTNWYGWAEADEVYSPGGSTTQLQYNNAGSFGGMSGTAWDDTNRALTLTGATVTTSKPVFDLSQTWNAAGVTFTGMKFNVTNTASASGSLLADWRVSGVSVLALDKNGIIRRPNGGYTGWINVNSDGTGGGVGFGQTIGVPVGTTDSTIFFKLSGTATLSMASGYAIGWTSSSTNAYGANDLFLYRDAANTLAQRNGTTAQEDRLYRSYTDASNYSRLVRRFNTTTAVIHAEGTGSGSDGSVAFNDAALSTSATVGFVMIPSCAGTPTGVPADIPTGQCPMVVDSSGTKLYVYVGGAWKSCTLA